jgi:acyl-[acyl-carrier-protein]-phospholipid O-acyltransferase/long-chain-fatty-acid--[acyl-carrier-protein] ligase
VFVQKARLGDSVAALEAHVRSVWLEDLRKTVTTPDKLIALTAGRQHGKIAPDDTAAVLFTSGSGTPGGALPPQHPVEHRPGRRTHRFRPG